MNIEKKKNFIINTLYIAIISVIVFFIIKYGLGLLAPFIIAFIIAYCLKKPTDWVSNKLKLPKKLTSILMVILFFSTIGVIIVLLTLRIGSGVAYLFTFLPEFYTTQLSPTLMAFFDVIEGMFKSMDPQLIQTLSDVLNQSLKALGDLLSNLSVMVISSVTNYASALPELLIRILFTLISTFFIAIDYDQIVAFLQRQLSQKTFTLVTHIKDYIVGTLFVCIRSYALIMFITFVELAIGLSIIRVENSLFIALLISVFDILPVLGTGGIMIPWIILTAFQGNYVMAIGLLVVYLIITVIRNIIEPKIVGQQIGLHPVVTLLSMFIGTKLFGVLGLFGLPITLSLLNHLNEDGTIKIFK
ncbi:sporulation integral membrane protein YtvI [Anaerorhabdus sp.]|uniref:sporulation integral membrane protein YtvI n=1 Tax=Anaerorhabdus sp. TaxID=1872524 RepID=UPI002FCC384F